MPLKRDADEIFAHIASLAQGLAHDPARKWWPKCLFRSDHVENTARILNSGYLLSRAMAERRGVIVKDSASSEHLEEMTVSQRAFVRLYYRPGTPTQYANEGIRPASKIEYEAHMPVPIYLVFSAKLLAEEGISFTRGRLGWFSEVGSSVGFLSQTDFRDVYHSSWVGPPGSPGRGRILNARNSEVLAKDSLSLEYVRYVVCRSEAERDTLLSLLTDSARHRWISRVVVDEGSWGLFHRRATYVRDAELTASNSRFAFFSDRRRDWRGPFEMIIVWDYGNQSAFYSKSGFFAGVDPLKFNLGVPREHYTVRVELDGNLAYFSEYSSVDDFVLPF